jgi:hypothetical protein
MLMPLLLLCALPVEAKSLEIRHVQAAYDYLSPERQDLDFYLPEDLILFRFVVKGLRLRDGHGIDAETEIQLLNAWGKVVQLERKPFAFDTEFPGNEAWFFAALPIRGAMTVGEYTCKVTVRDNVSAASSRFERKIRIRPARFGVQSILYFHDAEYRFPAPATVQVCQNIHARLALRGFAVKDGQCDLDLVQSVIDADTEEILLSHEANLKVAAQATGAPCFNAATGMISRPGRFILRFEVTDNNAGKSVTFEAPLRVTRP